LLQQVRPHHAHPAKAAGAHCRKVVDSPARGALMIHLSGAGREGDMQYVAMSRKVFFRPMADTLMPPRKQTFRTGHVAT
jgi:hypothetical protein